MSTQESTDQESQDRAHRRMNPPRSSPPRTRNRASRKRTQREETPKQRPSAKKRKQRETTGRKVTEQPPEDFVVISDTGESDDEFIVIDDIDDSPVTISSDSQVIPQASSFESSYSRRSLSPILEEPEGDDESSNQTNPHREIFCTKDDDSDGSDSHVTNNDTDESDDDLDRETYGRFKRDGPNGYPKEYYDKTLDLTETEIEQLCKFRSLILRQKLRDLNREKDFAKSVDLNYDNQANQSQAQQSENTRDFGYVYYPYAPRDNCKTAESVARREPIANPNSRENRHSSPEQKGMSMVEFLMSKYHKQQVIQDNHSSEMNFEVAAIDLDQPEPWSQLKLEPISDDELTTTDHQDRNKKEPIGEPDLLAKASTSQSSPKPSVDESTVKKEPVEPFFNRPRITVRPIDDLRTFINKSIDVLTSRDRDSQQLYEAVSQRSFPSRPQSPILTRGHNARLLRKRKRARRSKAKPRNKRKRFCRLAMSDHDEETIEETTRRHNELQRELQTWFDRHNEADRI